MWIDLLFETTMTAWENCCWFNQYQVRQVNLQRDLTLTSWSSAAKEGRDFSHKRSLMQYLSIDNMYESPITGVAMGVAPVNDTCFHLSCD